MNTWCLSLTLCASLLAGQAPVQEQHPPAIPPALQQRYDKLVEDWDAAMATYNRDATEARAQHRQLPSGPHKLFAPRFVELGRAGHPGAASWCLQFVAMTSDVATEARDTFLACEATLVPYALAAEDPARPLSAWPAICGIPEILRSIGGAMSTIGKQRALALCEEILGKVATPESKSLALEVEVGIWFQGVGNNAEPPAEGLALLRRLVKDFPSTEPGARAVGQLFRVENLRVGKTPPDFETKDVDDKPFKLSDYRGKVVVIEFWGAWNHSCLKLIPDQRDLVDRLKDKPFALIGIATDTDKDVFRKLAQERGVNWRNSWQGSMNGELLRAWGVRSVPTTFVLDAKGVVRYVGVLGDPLEKAVNTLLLEMASGDGKH